MRTQGQNDTLLLLTVEIKEVEITMIRDRTKENLFEKKNKQRVGQKPVRETEVMKQCPI